MSLTEILAGILDGAGVTLRVVAYALAYAIPFALLFGTLQYLARGAARACVTVVIEFWRSNSVIILLYVFYYLLPFVGMRWSAMDVAALVLGCNVGSYASQVVRAALQAVARGQLQAGKALGLKRLQVLLLIEFPQSIRPMIPSLMNETIRLIQSTALVSLLALSDMTLRAKEIAQTTYQPVGIYTALLIAYFLLAYPFALLGRRLESWVVKGKGVRDAL